MNHVVFLIVGEWFGGRSLSGRSGHFLLNLQKTTGNALPVVFDSGEA
jgi:hypothetical protein